MLRDITAALADVLREDIAGELQNDDIDVTVEPRFVPSPSEGICLDVFPGSPARTSDGAGFGQLAGAYVLTVRARVSPNELDEAQDILTDMIDDQHALSVAAAVESDQTLGGWATDVYVDPEAFSGLLDFGAAPGTMIGCTWRVLVQAAES